MFFSSQLKHTRGFDVRLKSLRLEVKGARPHINGGWLFHLDKKYQHRWGDFYILVAFDKMFQVENMYIIPRAELIGLKHVWLGKRTVKKWDNFRVQ